MLTRFEKARIIGARSLQIAMGAPILIKLNSSLKSAYDIASKEFEEKVLPLTVVRRLPNGKTIEVEIE